MEAKKTASGAEQGGVEFSIKNIVGESGKNYGNGVYLDSNLLENLSDSERVEMVKMRIGELGGKTFIAYDGSTPVEIKIESSKTRFTNKNGRFVQVNRDLTTKNIGKKIKQETVVLSDELISYSAYKESAPARYSHGWLDNKGQNKWEKRTVFVQEKNNSVWEATLHIANAKNGEKILYDIDPIKIVERRGKSRTNTTNANIRSSGEKVNTQFSKRAEIFAQLDSEYAKTVENNDTEAAQRLVDEAAKEAGYTVKAYHGTLTKGIHKFDKKYIGSRFSFDEVGFFFTDLKSIAEDYATSEFDSDKKGEVISAYLRMKKPFIFNKNFAIKNGYGNVFRDNDSIGVWDAYQGAILDEIYGKRFDGIIVDDGTSKMYVVFDPNQIKSSDAVTYDDEGNVIPLSERFNERNEDIRFSKRSKLDSFNAESYNEIKLGKQEYARLSAAIGTEQPNAKGIVTQILDNENGESALVYTAFVDDGKLKVLYKKKAKYIDEKRTTYANGKSESFDKNAGEFRNKRNDSSGVLGIERKPNGRNDGNTGGNARGRDGRNGRGSNQDVSDSSEGSRENLTVSDLGKIQYQLRIEDKNRLDILDKQETRLTADLKTLEKAYGEVIRREYEQNIKPDEGTSERAARINEKAAMFWLALRKIQKDNYILFGLS